MPPNDKVDACGRQQGAEEPARLVDPCAMDE